MATIVAYGVLNSHDAIAAGVAHLLVNKELAGFGTNDGAFPPSW